MTAPASSSRADWSTHEGWVSPTWGHSGLRDENLCTGSTWVYTGWGTWSEFIEFGLDNDLLTDGLRISHKNTRLHHYSIDIDIRVDGNWVDLFDGDSRIGNLYWTCGQYKSNLELFEFEQVPVDAARIRFWVPRGTYWSRVFEADFRGEEEKPIQATIDIDPDTLNLKSKGKWITAHIDLPEGNDVNDINVSTVMLNDLIQAEWGDVQDESLMVKFDRSEVEDILSPSEAVTLTVSGELYDGTRFEGSDDIRVIQPG